MNRHGDALRRGWFALTAAVSGAGLVLQFVLTLTGGQDANTGDVVAAVPLGTRVVRFFSFFTVQSNIIVCAVGVIGALPDRARRHGTRWWCTAQLDALLAITITGIVFVTVLLPLVQVSGVGAVANALLHYVPPLLVVIGWLLVGPRRQFTWPVVGLAFAWPVAWLIYTFVRGALVSWYPYPFLDAGELGTGAAVRNSLLVVVFGLALAALFLLADRRLPSLGTTRREP